MCFVMNIAKIVIIIKSTHLKELFFCCSFFIALYEDLYVHFTTFAMLNRCSTNYSYTMQKFLKFPLLARIVIAIVLGIVLGQVANETCVRFFVTFSGLFGQFLGFLVPIIIVGLVTPAIADIGGGAGRLLALTVFIAFADTVIAGYLAYATGEAFFPAMIASAGHVDAPGAEASLKPFFELNIPPLFDVMSALVVSFVLGLGIAYKGNKILHGAFSELRDIVDATISKVVIPLLPIYIFSIFLNMAYSGEAFRIISVFAQIILVIVVLHVVILLYEYIFVGIVSHRNPIRLLLNMMPAYFTALGTSSSAATIPVTLRQTLKNGVSEDIAGFTIPLCATIHLSGSMMKITACAFTICMLNGIPHDLMLFTHFILILSICMVAAPGVPGGAVMAALAPLASVLGFDADMQALMIALYIAMDSFGTACNVTGDGAIAILINRIKNHSKKDCSVVE